MLDETMLENNKIPFFLIFLAIFFRGSTFIIINAPVIFHFVQDSSFPDFSRVISDGIINTWKDILRFKHLSHRYLYLYFLV